MQIVPRKPQALAIAKAVPALRKHKRALVVLATAIGKTITSALIAQRLKARRVLFLVHNNFILENSLKEYEKVFGENRTYALYNGMSKNGAATADFVFASLQTMGNHLKEWKRNHFDLVVVDESHHSHAETYCPVIKHFTAARLGITATPNRTDLQDIRTLFGEEVINIPLEQAIANGWLLRIEYHVVTDDGFDEEALARITKEVMHEGKRMSIEELNRRVFIKARDRKIASIIEGYDEKTLIFCRNITHADNFRTFLRSSATFHSQTGRSTRKTWGKNQAVLEDLRNGLLRRVLAVNAFNEGVDVPSIGLVVFLRTTDSENIFYQQLGRGCRPGKEKLVILDFVGNVQRIMMLQQMRDHVAYFHELATTAGDRASEGYTDTPLHLSGKGFEFTFSDKIVDLMKVVNRIKVDLYPTWQEAADATARLGIKTKEDYGRRHHEDRRLPSRPMYYRDCASWTTFFGKKDVAGQYPTWQQASRASKKLGVKSSVDYSRQYKKDLRLPASPRKCYPHFPGWEKFLGKEQKDLYPTWQQASRAAKKLGIKSHSEYGKLYKRDPRLPSSPYSSYKDFPGMTRFLARS